jgi:hypothetical protein
MSQALPRNGAHPYDSGLEVSSQAPLLCVNAVLTSVTGPTT